MSLSVKQLTQPSLRTPLHARTAKHVAFERLPALSSTEEACEERGYLYVAYGTTCHQVLFPRMSERLVSSRPRKPQRKTAVPASRTSNHKPKIQWPEWPDACNAKDLATFYQNHLSPKSDPPAKIHDGLYTLATLPALLRGAPVPPINKATTHPREPAPSIVKPAPPLRNAARPPATRFGRAMNEA